MSKTELIDEKPENPLAYPRNKWTPDNQDVSEGLFLRDYFAIRAPITISDAERSLKDENAGFVSYGDIMKRLSQMQFAYADAMLKARSK